MGLTMMTYPMKLAALAMTVAALSFATGHWLGEQSKERFGSIEVVNVERASPVLAMTAPPQDDERAIPGR
jgi:hypothetical protein